MIKFQPAERIEQYLELFVYLVEHSRLDARDRSIGDSIIASLEEHSITQNLNSNRHKQRIEHYLKVHVSFLNSLNIHCLDLSYLSVDNVALCKFSRLVYYTNHTERRHDIRTNSSKERSPSPSSSTSFMHLVKASVSIGS